MGIPYCILLKPGRFEPHEFEIMKRHTILGPDGMPHDKAVAIIVAG